LQISSPKSAMKRFTPSCASSWWVGNRRTTSSEWGSKRKLQCSRLLLQSYSTSPSVRSSTKVSVSPVSDIYTITSRFGSHRVRVLIIISSHGSTDIVKCSADRLMRSAPASQDQNRTQTGASSNTYFACLIFQSIYLGFSIFQHMTYTKDSGEHSRNDQEQKEQGKCSFRALISVVPNSFSACFHALTISLSQNITSLHYFD
jgi:hypothetical protein